MRRAAVLLSLLPVLSLTPPAHAVDPYVEVSYTIHSVTYEGNSWIVAYCEATSSAGTSGDFPTQTGVTCSVNGVDVTSMGPNTKAYAVATHPFPRPVVFCWSGVALFFDTQIYTYARFAPRQCLTY